jgi:hypothetical protein
LLIDRETLINRHHGKLIAAADGGVATKRINRIIGSAFRFGDDESGCVTAIPGYPTRQIAD